jgi:hypothetical protein
VIEITGLAFAFKAAGETQRRVERGLICYSADEFPLPVFRQMSSMFDQIEREWVKYKIAFDPTDNAATVEPLSGFRARLG